MKVTAFIRQKQVAKNNTTDKSTIFFRIRDGKLDIKVASELSINANHWSDDRQGSSIVLISPGSTPKYCIFLR